MGEDDKKKTNHDRFIELALEALLCDDEKQREAIGEEIYKLDLPEDDKTQDQR